MVATVELRDAVRVCGWPRYDALVDVYASGDGADGSTGGALPLGEGGGSAGTGSALGLECRDAARCVMVECALCRVCVQ